jgi:hypothetical protein
MGKIFTKDWFSKCLLKNENICKKEQSYEGLLLNGINIRTLLISILRLC